MVSNLDDNLPIIFIHGLGGGPFQYKPIIRFLKKNGFNEFHEFEYKRKFGNVSLNSICDEFAEFVRSNVKNKKINIIGISQGGIIARLYIQYKSDKKVCKCITLCTPHQGSLMAYLTNLPGFLELRPKSDLLKKLQKSSDNKVSYYSVYTPFDLTVFPGINAKLKGAKRTKRIAAPLHALAIWWKPTLNFILESLNE